VAVAVGVAVAAPVGFSGIADITQRLLVPFV
jgi:hypothetical protein